MKHFFFAAIQWIVFHNAFLVLAAGLAFAALAFVTGHFSLGSLEKKVRANLQLLNFAPQQIFKEQEY